jgi:hypothetical protein
MSERPRDSRGRHYAGYATWEQVRAAMEARAFTLGPTKRVTARYRNADGEEVPEDLALEWLQLGLVARCIPGVLAAVDMAMREEERMARRARLMDAMGVDARPDAETEAEIRAMHSRPATVVYRRCEPPINSPDGEK